MRSVRTWSLSVLTAGGVAAGSLLGLNAEGSSARTAKATPTTEQGQQANSSLSSSFAALRAEDAALHRALAQARAHLAQQIAAREAALAKLQRARAGAATQLTSRVVTLSPAAAPGGASVVTSTPATTPPTQHTTTGASGVTSGSTETSDDGATDN